VFSVGSRQPGPSIFKKKEAPEKLRAERLKRRKLLVAAILVVEINGLLLRSLDREI